MKSLQTSLVLLFMVFATTNTFAQKIKLIEGDLSAVKTEKSINLQFTYENMAVGKFDTEKEYISSKKEEYNKKEAGKGDNWEKAWVADRKEKFEPKFKEMFEKSSKMTAIIDSAASNKYTLIFNTDFTEPGYNVMVSRKNASINGEVIIVETANKKHVIAKLSVKNAPGRTAGGYDMATGMRIVECYAIAGREIGEFITK